MKSSAVRRRSGIWGVVFAWLAVGVQGQMLEPLYMGNISPVLDPMGVPMAGSPKESEAEARSLVEIRVATNGMIYPPSPAGVSHPCNPLLDPGCTGGVGENAVGERSGLFCMAFPRRTPGTIVFARAFNAPTAEQATFYADSAAVAIPSRGSSLVLSFGETRPLDSGDSDGDGLGNSWEQYFGTDDRPAEDYDGDGMPDLQEMLAGSDPADPDSKLAFTVVRRESTPQMLDGGGAAIRPVRVRWQSVPGKKYRLEYVLQLVPDPATGEPNLFIPVGEVVTACEGEFEIEKLVDISADALTGTFRVKLVQE